MVIGHDIDHFRFGGDAAYFLFPSSQFRSAVEIVVAVSGSIGVKPLIVVSSVQSHIADRRSHVLGRFEGSANLGLIDVTKRDILFSEIADSLGILPAIMAHF